MTGPFFSSKMWVAQAGEDLRDFYKRAKTILSHEKSYTPFEDLERRPGSKVVGVKVVDVPATLSTKATQIVTALRSALDQAAWRASVLLGAKEREQIYFPIAGTKENFDGMFRGKGKAMNIPAELHPILIGFEGYPRDRNYDGGNDLLYVLSKISNPGKHTETYTVGVEIGDMGFSGVGDIVEMSMPPKFDPTKKEFVFYVTTLTGGFSHDIQIATHIAFNAVPIVGGQPVIPVLHTAIGMVDRIVASIEAETTRILRERNP